MSCGAPAQLYAAYRARDIVWRVANRLRLRRLTVGKKRLEAAQFGKRSSLPSDINALGGSVMKCRRP
ncbi:hypothetical protein LY76DRAFT_597404 [Colletotrichum caudatum]|nr:hypothetical protein LY76DRAFT_597404 [Colletotrichum caudatum]